MLNTTTPNIIPVNTVMNSTIDSLAMQLQNAVNFSVQIVFTGTPTGTFKLQASCDPVPKTSLVFGANGVVIYTPVNWSDLPDTSASITAAGNYFQNYENAGFNYVRVVYTDTSSGTSTAIITDATFNSKGI